MHLVNSLVLVVSILAPLTVWASDAPISLGDAVRQALARNHLLLAASHEQAAAKAERSASRSRYLPRLTLEESAVLTNSPTRAFMMRLDEGRFSLAGDLNHPDVTGDFQTAITLEQPLLDFRIGSVVAMAGKEVEKRDLALQRRREEIALKTVNVYLDLQKAKAQMQVAEQAVQDAREHLRLASVRGVAGVGLKSDELRARTFVADQEQQAIVARNDVQINMLRLAAVTGVDDGSGLDGAANYQAPAVAGNRHELERLALDSRLELKEMGAEVEKTELGIRNARAAYYPTVHGIARYQLNDRDIPFGRDNDAWLVGATLRWDLFDGDRRGHDTEKARAEKRSVEEYRAALRQEIRLQVAESSLRREETEKRLEVSRHAAADAAEGVRLLTRRYESSVSLMVELLDAQTVLNRARAQVAEMEAEFARASVQLLHASGMLLKEVMQ